MQERLAQLVNLLASICTFEQITEAQRIVDEEAPKLWAQVPEDHIWRAKEAHAKTVAAKGTIILKDMGLDPDKNPLAQLLLFIMSIHDLGRAIDALRSIDQLPAGFNKDDDHGIYTLQLLKLWGVLDLFLMDNNGAGILLSFVIKNHAAKQTPATVLIYALPLEEACFLTLALVRDLDKIAIYEEKTRPYIFSATEREGQALIIRKRFNPDYLPDDGPISDIVLQTFISGQQIERPWMMNNCDYMLQFLSWIRDVNFDTVLKQIVATDAIHVLLGYIFETQKMEVWAPIVNTTNDYLISREIWHGVNAGVAAQYYKTAKYKFSYKDGEYPG